MNSIALKNEHIYENTEENHGFWDTDFWKTSDLKKYNIKVSVSRTLTLNFSKIQNENFKLFLKKYMKERLLGARNFTQGTAQQYLMFLTGFFNYLNDLNPSYRDLNSLDRKCILSYFEKLRKDYTGSNINNYMLRRINLLETFLSDIQIREYNFAPKISVSKLIFKEDKPNMIKKSVDKIDYIPDEVLEQLFRHIDKISNKQVILIILIMFKTGLRISDTLNLRLDCLVNINDNFYLQVDITKTYVNGHRIPIDDELASMIAVMIEDVLKKYNAKENPERFLFPSKFKKRSGLPLTSKYVSEVLNKLSEKYKIVDNSNRIFRFKNHAFRHTYGVKLINSGVDIFTVQSLLAHASPEMTMRYAKLLDDTKREAFENVMASGVFSFGDDLNLVENETKEISKDIMDALWNNHKLSAIDTAYGTCLQRTNGRCEFAKAPPCLTCNGGKPCRDLCIGAFEGDVSKYSILIESTKKTIKFAKQYNRDDLAKENEELLSLYTDIFEKIKDGNIIYSKLNRLRRNSNE